MSASAFTLAIFKPHLLKNPVAYCAVEQLIAASGIQIVSRKKLSLSEHQAKQFYRDHEGKFFYGRLINLMTSGPLEVLVLSGENVISRWRALMGPTKVFKAIYSNPECIRSLYGLSDTRNASHGSVEMTETVLYISNLDQATTDMDLYQKFIRYGAIRSTALAQSIDPTGALLHHGIVAFFDAVSAAKARTEANGQLCRGKPMEITFGNSLFLF